MNRRRRLLRRALKLPPVRVPPYRVVFARITFDDGRTRDCTLRGYVERLRGRWSFTLSELPQ